MPKPENIYDLITDERVFILMCDACKEEIRNTGKMDLIRAATECGWVFSRGQGKVFCDDCFESV